MLKKILNVENQNLGRGKKTLNFDEDNQISSPMPGDDEMASAGLGPVFRSILKETAKKLSIKEIWRTIFRTA